MTLRSMEIHLVFNQKELDVLMVALSETAKASSVKMIPWDSCPFFRLYKELVRITGFRAADLQDLANKLSAR